MATIVKLPFRTFDVDNFIDKFQQHTVNSATIVPENYLYLAIAKQTAWGTAGSTGEELKPELPKDTIDQEVRFWTDLIAMQRVQPHQIVPVIERKNWSNQTKFVPFDTAKALHEQGNYYCINSLFQVFKCYQAHPTNNPSIEPTWQTGKAMIFPTNDGYQWEYLYQLSPVDIQNLEVQDAWIPIPINNKDSSYGGRDFPTRHIATRHLMIQITVTETSLPIKNADNTPVTYRQIGLVLNPIAATGTAKLTATTLMPTDVKKVTVANYPDVESRVIYLENRTVVTRQSGQSERPSIVVAM